MKKVPKYCRSRVTTGQDRAYCLLDGKRYWLGIFDAEASQAAYRRLISEWSAGQLRPGVPPDEITIVELLERYWSFAQSYYVGDDGLPTSTLGKIKIILRMMRELYGTLTCVSFGPRELKTLRAEMICAGWGRANVNSSIGTVKRIFKWGVAESILPPGVLLGLSAVGGLRRGRSQAKEGKGRKPVSDADVNAVTPLLSRTLAGLVQLQLLTGSRGGELLTLRMCDLDMSGRVWLYRPGSHKTAHHGHERVIFVGPKGQEILRGFMAGKATDGYLFTPADARCERAAEAPTHRRPGQQPTHEKRSEP